MTKDKYMNKTYEDAIEIIVESLAPKLYPKFVKLIFEDRNSHIDPSYIADIVYDNFIARGLFLETTNDSLGYFHDWEKMLLAFKIQISLATGDVSIIELEEDLVDESYFPYLDGKGEWYISTEDNISFSNHFETVIDRFIEYQVGYDYESRLRKKMEKYSSSPKMKKFEEFAKKIAGSKIVYSSLMEMIKEFEAGL